MASLFSRYCLTTWQIARGDRNPVRVTGSGRRSLYSVHVHLPHSSKMTSPRLTNFAPTPESLPPKGVVYRLGVAARDIPVHLTPLVCCSIRISLIRRASDSWQHCLAYGRTPSIFCCGQLLYAPTNSLSSIRMRNIHHSILLLCGRHHFRTLVVKSIIGI